jgi:outer membrane protein assembly factor BamB
MANAGSIRSVTIGGDVVIVAVERGFAALERTSGQIRWRRAMTSAHSAAIGSVEGATAVALLDDTGLLDVVDGRTGADLWSIRTMLESRMLAPRAGFVEDVVVLSWTDGTGTHLRGYPASGGTPIWEHDSPALATIPVIDSAGSVLFAENLRIGKGERYVSAQLVSISARDGRQQWATRLRSRTGFSPLVTTALGDGGVAFVDAAGRVVVSDRATGDIRWKWKTQRPQLEATPYVVGDLFAMTTYGTGALVAGMADGLPVEVDGVEPGQTVMTIQASAAAGEHLYLLVDWSWGDPEIWMLEPELA